MDATASLEDGVDTDGNEVTGDPTFNTVADPDLSPGKEPTEGTTNTVINPKGLDSTDFVISASETLSQALASESATVAVLPIDNASALVLAMVKDVGYKQNVPIKT
jgi:hypothetical protein